MSDGQRSGGRANRSWQRPGSRYVSDGMTPAGRHAFYLEHADEPFWCDTCTQVHPLREHRICRQGARSER